MKITAQEEYGLRCLLRLAQGGEGHSLSIAEIAAAEGLSAPYVAKLMSVLRNEGFVESARGRSGGYRLSQPPAEIRLGALLHALGEALFDEPSYCERHAGTETPGVCVHRGACSLRALWGALEVWMRGALDRISLADLLSGEALLTMILPQRLAEAAAESPRRRLPVVSAV